MDSEKRRILEMVGEGKISQEDALRLLDALEDERVDRAFEDAMARLRENPGGPAGQPQAGPGPAEPEVMPPQPAEGDIWGEVEEAAREVGQVLSQTAAVTMDAIAEGMQWAKGAVQKIPGVSVWWGNQQDIPEGEQPLPYHYPDGSTQVSKLDIQWVNGPVEIVPWEGQWVNVTEYAQYPLQESQQLELTVTDGGTMRIRWTKDKSFWKGLRLSKYLLVQVPAAMGLEKIKVENVSGSVQAENLHGEDFSLSTTSGQIEALGLRAEKLKLASVSGRVYGKNLQAGLIDAGSTSGKVDLYGFGCQRLKANTVSGSIHLYGNGESLQAKSVSGKVTLQTEPLTERLRLESLSGRLTLLLPQGFPESPGFRADFDSMSGSFSSGFPVGGILGGKSGQAVYGQGEMKIHLHTLSGKMEIQPVPEESASPAP